MKGTLTVKQLLALAATLTPGQLKMLNLNTRADGSLSDHGTIPRGVEKN